jgi:2-dehydropantoate 2-reductase
MSILIVGAGAVGGYYGGRLAQAGRDVTFLVRERRAAALREGGLRLVSPDRTEIIEPQVVTAGELAAGAGIASPASTVLVTVKAAGLDAAIEEMTPAIGPDTTVVPVLNGMRHLDMLNAAFGSARVLGGVAVLATQLDGNGDVTVLSPDASLTIGAQDRQRTPAVDRTNQLLDGAGFRVAISDDIVAAMWSKWAFIASAGAATCLLGATAGEIEAAGGDATARAIVEEAGTVAAASGYPIPDTEQKQTQAMLTAPGSSFASSMYRDLRQGRPVEVDTIHAAPSAAADGAACARRCWRRPRWPCASTTTGWPVAGRPGHDSAPGSVCSRGRAGPVRRSPHGERRNMAPAGRYSMKAVIRARGTLTHRQG